MGQENEMQKIRQKGVKGPKIVCSNDGQKVAAPKFQDAGSFIGAGSVDGAMQDVGDVGSLPKGEKSPAKPVLNKGSKGPKGPGVK